MTRHVLFGGGGLLLALGLVGVPGLAPARDAGADAKTAVRQDRVVAGSEKDFMEVRHLVLKGTNEEIGRALGTIARDRFKAEPVPSTDRTRTRAQRKYIEKNYPALFDRMRGAASAFGRKVDDDGFNLTGLWYPIDLGIGCSVIHFPPAVTATGAGVVSRNYDFTTGTLMGTRPAPGELPCTARPYLVEMHPDRGYASLAMYSYDLLSGALDGMNSEGLTVALLADDETLAKYGREPAGLDAAGLNELQVPRMLLDTCASVEEAKEALLTTKHYYAVVPVHYLIADRHGKSFVWEYSQAHNREYIIENPGRPLVTTNFSLHRHLEKGSPPSAAKMKEACPRYCALTNRLTENGGKVSEEFIKECHKLADIVQAPRAGGVPTRTLWHALYFPEARKVQVSFYLRDETDPNAAGKTRIARTDYLEFTLDKAK
jgi:hypothetical protein